MKTYGEAKLQFHQFPPVLTSAVERGEWRASRSCSFTVGETALGTYCIGGWVGPKADLDVIEKNLLTVLGIGPRLLDQLLAFSLYLFLRVSCLLAYFRLYLSYFHWPSICISFLYSGDVRFESRQRYQLS
jgi:hypothetical protein